MSFFGCTFSFDGVSSEEFGLVLYEVGSTKQNTTSFETTMELHEDRIPNRNRPLFYGAYQNTSLSFPLTFGLKPSIYNDGGSLDRSDFQRIASWLTGQDQYKWLVIYQDDLFFARYRCVIQDLSVINTSLSPVAFTCTVQCDSPFAYLPKEKYQLNLSGSSEINIRNRSSMNMPYYPVILLKGDGVSDFKMEAVRESRTTELVGISTEPGTIRMDCENEILTCENDLNLYQYFNFKFPRLLRGDNQFIVSWNGTMTIECDFPINIGS